MQAGVRPNVFFAREGGALQQLTRFTSINVNQPSGKTPIVIESGVDGITVPGAEAHGITLEVVAIGSGWEVPFSEIAGQHENCSMQLFFGDESVLYECQIGSFSAQYSTTERNLTGTVEFICKPASCKRFA